MPTAIETKGHKTTHRPSRRTHPKHARRTRQYQAGTTPIAPHKGQLGACGFNPLSITVKPLTGLDILMRTCPGNALSHEAGQVDFLQKYISSFPEANILVSPRTPLKHLMEQVVNKYTHKVPGATIILRDNQYLVNIERICGPDGACHLPLHWLPILKEVSPKLYQLIFWGLIWLQQKGVNQLSHLCKHDYFYDEGLMDMKNPYNEWGTPDSKNGELHPAIEYRKKWETTVVLYSTGPAAKLAKQMQRGASRKQWIQAHDAWFAISPHKHNGLEQAFNPLIQKLRILFEYKDHIKDYYLLSGEDRERMVMDGEDWCTPMDMFWYNWNDSEEDIMAELINEHLNERYSNYGSIAATVKREVPLGQPLPDLLNKQPLPDLLNKFFQEVYNIQDAWFEYDPIAIKTTLKHELSYNYGKLINIL